MEAQPSGEVRPMREGDVEQPQDLVEETPNATPENPGVIPPAADAVSSEPQTSPLVAQTPEDAKDQLVVEKEKKKIDAVILKMAEQAKNKKLKALNKYRKRSVGEELIESLKRAAKKALVGGAIGTIFGGPAGTLVGAAGGVASEIGSSVIKFARAGIDKLREGKENRTEDLRKELESDEQNKIDRLGSIALAFQKSLRNNGKAEIEGEEGTQYSSDELRLMYFAYASKSSDKDAEENADRIENEKEYRRRELPWKIGEAAAGLVTGILGGLAVAEASKTLIVEFVKHQGVNIHGAGVGEAAKYSPQLQHFQSAGHNVHLQNHELVFNYHHGEQAALQNALSNPTAPSWLSMNMQTDLMRHGMHEMLTQRSGESVADLAQRSTDFINNVFLPKVLEEANKRIVEIVAGIGVASLTVDVLSNRSQTSKLEAEAEKGGRAQEALDSIQDNLPNPDQSEHQAAENIPMPEGYPRGYYAPRADLPEGTLTIPAGQLVFLNGYLPEANTVNLLIMDNGATTAQANIDLDLFKASFVPSPQSMPQPGEAAPPAPKVNAEAEDLEAKTKDENYLKEGEKWYFVSHLEGRPKVGSVIKGKVKQVPLPEIVDGSCVIESVSENQVTFKAQEIRKGFLNKKKGQPELRGYTISKEDFLKYFASETATNNRAAEEARLAAEREAAEEGGDDDEDDEKNFHPIDSLQTADGIIDNKSSYTYTDPSGIPYRIQVQIIEANKAKSGPDDDEVHIYYSINGGTLGDGAGVVVTDSRAAFEKRPLNNDGFIAQLVESRKPATKPEAPPEEGATDNEGDAAKEKEKNKDYVELGETTINLGHDTEHNLYPYFNFYPGAKNYRNKDGKTVAINKVELKKQETGLSGKKQGRIDLEDGWKLKVTYDVEGAGPITEERTIEEWKVFVLDYFQHPKRGAATGYRQDAVLSSEVEFGTGNQTAEPTPPPYPNFPPLPPPPAPEPEAETTPPAQEAVALKGSPPISEEEWDNYSTLRDKKFNRLEDPTLEDLTTEEWESYNRMNARLHEVQQMSVDEALAANLNLWEERAYTDPTPGSNWTKYSAKKHELFMEDYRRRQAAKASAASGEIPVPEVATAAQPADSAEPIVTLPPATEEPANPEEAYQRLEAILPKLKECGQFRVPPIEGPMQLPGQIRELLEQQKLFSHFGVTGWAKVPKGSEFTASIAGVGKREGVKMPFLTLSVTEFDRHPSLTGGAYDRRYISDLDATSSDIDLLETAIAEKPAIAIIIRDRNGKLYQRADDTIIEKGNRYKLRELDQDLIPIGEPIEISTTLLTDWYIISLEPLPQYRMVGEGIRLDFGEGGYFDLKRDYPEAERPEIKFAIDGRIIPVKLASVLRPDTRQDLSGAADISFKFVGANKEEFAESIHLSTFRALLAESQNAGLFRGNNVREPEGVTREVFVAPTALKDWLLRNAPPEVEKSPPDIETQNAPKPYERIEGGIKFNFEGKSPVTLIPDPAHKRSFLLGKGDKSIKGWIDRVEAPDGELGDDTNVTVHFETENGEPRSLERSLKKWREMLEGKNG